MSKRARKDSHGGGACTVVGWTCVPVKGSVDGSYVLLRVDDVDSCVVHVCNLDVDVTQEDLRDALGADVEVAMVGTQGQARVRFADAAKAQAVCGMQRITLRPSAGLRGLDKYLAECQQRPDPVALARQVDEYMAAFDAREAAKKEELAAAPVVDADGFTLVTRARKGNTKQGKHGVKATTVRKRAPKQQGNAEPNFYQHVALQRKMDQLNELRTKHEADRARLVALKGERGSRKFRP
jgi:hypothetical protein